MIGAGVLLLLAVAIVRTAVPDRSRIRPLSLQGLDIPSEPIKQGETLTREKHWDPPDDVYLVGWNPRVGAHGSGAELALFIGQTRLFEYFEGRGAISVASFPAGTGFVLRKAQRLTLRLRVANSGPDSETQGAGALIYFVPVEGN